MPKPVKKVKQDPLAKDMARVQGQPAADQMILDPETVIREHMRKIGAEGGKVSGAKRMENLSGKQRRAIALKGAQARWATRQKESKK